MTRTRKHDVTGTNLGDEMVRSSESSLSWPDTASLIEVSTINQSKDVKIFTHGVTGKYYACWYKPELSGFTEVSEVPAVWAQNVLQGNVSFIDPIQSGNDKSGESYNLGEFEALHRRMEWEVQKTTYWRKEAESRQRDIENLNLKLKRQKKDLNGLLWCVILVLISTALIITLK